MDLPLDVVGRALQHTTTEIDPVYHTALERKTTAYLGRSSPTAAAEAAAEAVKASLNVLMEVLNI